MRNSKIQRAQKKGAAKPVSAKKTATPARDPAEATFSTLGVGTRVDGQLGQAEVSSLQQTLGNHATGRLIRAKLKVGRSNDQYEQEADRVAEQVTNMPAPVGTQGPVAAGSNAGGTVQRAAAMEEDKRFVGPHEKFNGPLEEDESIQRAEMKEEEPVQRQAGVEEEGVQRQASEEESEQVSRQPVKEEEKKIQRQPEEEEPVQAKAASRPAPSISPKVATNIHAMKGGGQPLPEATRAAFEPRFGYDFSHVRVHTDTPATESAAAIKARAFTVGSDIAFGAGEYAPESAAGQKLLAHELTHVVQQDGQMATLRSKGIDVHKTGRPMVQGGFFGSLWKGIKKVGKAIGKGAKAVGGAIWKGAKAVGGAIWKGAKAVGKWGWNVLKAGGAWVWNLFTQAPLRLWRIIEHLGSGAVGIVKWLWQGIKTVRGIKSFAQWIWSGFLSGAAWVGRLITKLLDVIGIGEIMDLLWQIIKFNTRTLSSTEIAEAKKVFGSSISYWQVRIDEYSLIAWIGSLFSGGGGMGVTTFHTINFNHKIKTAPGNSDMAWLIHELTHVSQYEHVGSQYMGEALHAQATGGYGYGGEPALLAAFAAGKHLRDFNREQQGDIARDFYLALTSGRPTTAYDPFIVELRAGKL